MKLILVIAFSVLAGGILAGGETELSGQKKLRRLREDTAYCQSCFQDAQAESTVRRAAFRRLLKSERHAAQILKTALHDTDPVIRRYALYETFQSNGAESYEVLKNAVPDPDLDVARIVLACAVNFPERQRSTELLALLSKEGKHSEVRREANRIVDFPFYKINKRLKDNPSYDHDIVTVKSFLLPQQGWRFKVDPNANGHHKGFFRPEFNDAKWAPQRVGAWEEQGFPGYDGIAWYRIRFRMAEKIDSNAVELSFGAVDEVAWVWLNGVYIGQHDLGPKGWDLPFDLNATEAIRWNEENLLVVRVEDTVAAGGIWKPIRINILK